MQKKKKKRKKSHPHNLKQINQLISSQIQQYQRVVIGGEEFQIEMFHSL